MSCFLVSKASFAKAAGIVAGIAAAANEGNQTDRFWLYDTKHNRNMIAEDYQENFFKVYEMNRQSVSESWGEEQKPDTNDYEYEFRQAVKIGKKAYHSRWENGGYLRLVQELQFFFRGIRYQIDNPQLERKAAGFLNAVAVKLFEQLDSYSDHDSWGDFDLATAELILTEEETKVELYVKRSIGIATA